MQSTYSQLPEPIVLSPLEKKRDSRKPSDKSAPRFITCWRILVVIVLIALFIAVYAFPIFVSFHPEYEDNPTKMAAITASYPTFIIILGICFYRRDETGQPARNLNTILFWCANICFVLFVLIFSSVMFYLVTFLYANESSDFVFFLTLAYMLVTVFFTMAFCVYEICLQDLIPDVLCYCNREKSTKRTEKLTTYLQQVVWEKNERIIEESREDSYRRFPPHMGGYFLRKRTNFFDFTLSFVLGPDRRVEDCPEIMERGRTNFYHMNLDPYCHCCVSRELLDIMNRENTRT